MKVAVTGGCGFIGSKIVELLLKEKDVSEIVVLDNLSVGDVQRLPKDERVHFLWCDIRNSDSLQDALKGVSVVFHDAAYVSIRGSFEKIRYDLEVNDLGTLNVLESARLVGARKVVIASSMAVYGHPVKLPIGEEDTVLPISPYGFSKLKSEHYCNIFSSRYGIKTVVLRYFNTFGIGQTLTDYVGVVSIFINQALKEQPLTIFGDGNQTRDFVHVDDVARANILAGIREDVEGVFNVASGREISINQIAQAIMENTGFKKTIYKPAPGGEIRRIVANICKAQNAFGFKANTDFEEKLPSIINWWRKKG